MRVLVTGAGGFVGRHLCEHLTATGDTVIPCPGPGLIGGVDVTDFGRLFQHMRDSLPDAIIHLAGVSSVSWSNTHPSETFRINVLGTVNILEAARRAVPDCRLVVVGSGEMYGPLHEGQRAREGDPLNPMSPYAASKCAAELIARQYSATYGLHTILVRPFNHIGRGQGANFVIPSLARQVVEVQRGQRPPVIEVGDLSSTRDFLHIDDVVRGYRLFLSAGEVASPYNICSGTGRTIRSLLDELLALAEIDARVQVDPARLRKSEIPLLIGDPGRANDLGWKPALSVSDALRDVLAEHGKWPTQ